MATDAFFVRVMQTGGSTDGFTVVDMNTDFQLSGAKIPLFFYDNPSFDSLRVNIRQARQYTDSYNVSAIKYQSQSISKVTLDLTKSQIAYLYFEFSNLVPLVSGTRYFFEVEITNYSFASDSFIAMIPDIQSKTYSNEHNFQDIWKAQNKITLIGKDYYEL